MQDRVLIVDDDPSTCELLCPALKSAGLAVLWTRVSEEGLALVVEPTTRVLVAELSLPSRSLAGLAEQVSRHRPDLPVVLLGDAQALARAPAALAQLRHERLERPLDARRLVEAVWRAAQGTAASPPPGAPPDSSAPYGNLLGQSPKMQQVYELIDRVAGSELPVLVTGESGTGKELVARELHRRSPRSAGPFVAVNCAALPETLLESELFGHVRGAFTDAHCSHEGLFCRAHGGTILLDEIGDLPLGLQPKLLRALEEGKVRPLGSTTEVPFDARVITATHQDLEGAIADKTFREDLYYRVNVIQLPLPPLRDRGDDVLLLARSLVQELARRTGRPPPTLSEAVRDRLMRHEWRGNVRELRNCIERALALSAGAQIVLSDLPPRLQEGMLHGTLDPPLPSRPRQQPPADLVPLEVVERRYILHVLDACGGNKSIAARLLGLNRKTLYRRLDAFGSEGTAGRASDVRGPRGANRSEQARDSDGNGGSERPAILVPHAAE